MQVTMGTKTAVGETALIHCRSAVIIIIIIIIIIMLYNTSDGKQEVKNKKGEVHRLC